ncbi:LysR family transcriptional regulator [Janthinobacterium agaricidamnosum]|uniref:Bacterial regulatory helix-turn-helix, lysR family protein n=1 Tax=Janthinobacterium agaricidamnosum NBRC 102515 = DSM 9628 TaxID=1349767 RepID=W0V6I5_9BURK|nr:LysR substrate-binding domain-containing protein [Janthinobacterium agaricidamnosum]CDG83230.1 bacterial regulatory helix-turn-helix, lysR family protein [Janthinobacterium agaricidamnosum NBRC 102515 = DSM 9628]
MELRHFRCFLAVARLLHFSRAAAELGMSPPALSKQIQEAENQLGTRLFNRSKRSVALTSAGQLFEIEAQRALQQFELAQEVARRAGRGELGRLELGYVASAAYAGVLQQQFALFRRSHPGIELRSKEYPMELLPELLDQHRLDLAFVRPPMAYPEGIDSVVLLRDRFVVALRDDSPLALLGDIAPARLSQEAFIVPEQELGTAQVSQRGGFTARISDRPGSLLAVLTEVSLGAGCAVVPFSVVDHVRLPGVCYREIAGPPIASEIAAAFRRHEKAPAALAFINQIKRMPAA